MTITQPLWAARIWEDGTFSLGYLPQRKLDTSSDFGQELSEPEHCELMQMGINAHGIAAMMEFVSEHPEYYPVLLASAPLDSSIVSKSHRESVARGQEGISAYGKKLVRNAALRLEKEAGVKNLSFLTLTIPGLGASGALSVCENWGEIVRIFQQKLKRLLQSYGLPGEIVGVTEVQEKRFAASNVVALHLHLLFQGRKCYQTWAIRPGQVRAAWKSVLRKFIDDDEGNLYWDACENLVPVRLSAVGYLGKYMSKGVKTCDKVRKVFPEIVLPKCWYICTNTLRRRVKQCVAYLTSTYSPEFEALITSDNTSEVCDYLYPVHIRLNTGKVVTIGYTGKLKPYWNRCVLSAHEESLQSFMNRK